MLTRREKAAQIVFGRIGSNIPPPVPVEEDLDRVESILSREAFGGFILFNGRLDTTPEVISVLQRKSDRPLLFAADIERGAGQQIAGATLFPHALAYAAAGADGASLVEASARATAREALAAGLHITFAPVADINRDPRNPIIATRAFGETPEEAARLVRAYIRGVQAEGLLATTKHFPGHGNTHQDSHDDLPVVADDLETLERTDLVPFRVAIQEEVDLMMSAHVVYPALDPARWPATLSAPILTELLRKQLGFRGVTVSDSLMMGGVRGLGLDDVALYGGMVAAGMDILLDPPDPIAVVDALIAALDRGLLLEERLDEAVDRVERLRDRIATRFGAEFFRDPGRTIPRAEIGNPDHLELASRSARAAIRILSDPDGLIPLRDEEPPAVVFVTPYRATDAGQEPFQAALARLRPDAPFVKLDPDSPAGTYEQARSAIRAARRILLAIVVKPAAWHRFGLLDGQMEFVRSVVAERSTVVASLGAPYVLSDLSSAAARLCTYSDVPASQVALADVLFGSTAA